MSSNSNAGAVADEDELVLSVVRRLHAGDTPLHTLVRAATYMEVGKCAGKIRALLARDANSSCAIKPAAHPITDASPAAANIRPRKIFNT